MTAEGPHTVEDQDATPPAPGSTMRAVVRERYGPAETLHLAQVPVPVPGAKEVLLRVHAAGLDRGTWHLMTGRPYLLRLGFGLRAPRNPVAGMEVAGTVAAFGSAVTGFTVEQEVYGIARGSFAEYAVARAAQLAPAPGNLTAAQAAVVPISAVTALHALCRAGHLHAGQKVLITGASGGVGSYAVQLAKALDAEVTAVTSTGTVEHVLSLGADHVVDRTGEDFADGTHHYDLVLDLAGNPPLSRLRRALTPAGTAVLVGGEDGDRLTGGMGRSLRALVLSPFIRQRFTNLVSTTRSGDLHRLTELIEAGQVVPPLERVYPLERAAEAMRRLDAGTVRGKIALTV
ncbi:NAD(P)-dependent alcohol dehydrogenase [Kocuria sp. CPCC 205268]|uniref:NAD(P)-dependent alcohol dehydrogenase n=1 Tax=Kocuria oxytropis TaxID=3058913 RepID=UPI0034D69CE9